MLKPANEKIYNAAATSSREQAAHSENDHEEHKTVTEIVEESVKGEDEPMEVNHPTAPGALVWFTYPVLLVVLLLIVFAIMAFTGAEPAQP